jgi:hypothetical protein
MITYYLLHNLFRKLDIFHYMRYFLRNLLLLTEDDGMCAIWIVKTSIFIYRSVKQRYSSFSSISSAIPQISGYRHTKQLQMRNY